MSRIGKKPVPLPSGVQATVSGQTVEVKGPKGNRSFTATDDVTITMEDNTISVMPRGKSKRALQQWGMSRTMVANLVTGVSDGFKRELEITGPTVFDHYLGDGPDNLDVFSEDGYFKTGDLFEIAGDDDPPRFYRFVGRSKEIIIRGGYNISPDELDAP